MGSKKAPPPDPAQQALAYAQADAMKEQLGLTRDYYGWAKQQAEIDRQRGDEQFNWYRGLQDEAMDRSRRLDDRYWNTTAKQEDQFYNMVDQYDTAAERDRIAGAAMSDVEGAAQASRLGLGREIAARGLNSGSGAYLGALADNATDFSLAKAAAATASQAASREKGFNLRAMAAGLGGNLQGASAGYLGQAGDAAGAGLNAGTQGLRSAATAWSGLNQGMTGAMNWGGSANSTFNSLNDYNIQRAKTGGSGLGSIFGGIAGSFLGPVGGSFGSALGKKWFG